MPSRLGRWPKKDDDAKRLSNSNGRRSMSPRKTGVRSNNPIDLPTNSAPTLTGNASSSSNAIECREVGAVQVHVIA